MAQIADLEAQLADARQAESHPLEQRQQTDAREAMDSEYLGLQERQLLMEQQMLELVEERR